MINVLNMGALLISPLADFVLVTFVIYARTIVLKITKNILFLYADYVMLFMSSKID